MTRRVTWVIGGGGRLGRAVHRQLAADPAITVFTPTEAVPWTKPVQAIEVLERTLACFASLEAAGAVQEVYWAAGRCTMGSDEAQTLGEAQDFYADLKGRLAAHGRRPEDLLILPGISPVIGLDASAR